jgi:hypothetical protein
MQMMIRTQVAHRAACLMSAWTSASGLFLAEGFYSQRIDIRRLKLLVAELSLHGEALKAVTRKNGWSLPV